MSEYSLVFHAGTTTDHNEAYFWYEERRKGLGDKFLAAMNDKVQQILNNPETFSARSKAGYYEALITDLQYTIAYKIYKKQRMVFITSIHHKRNIHKKNIENNMARKLKTLGAVIVKETFIYGLCFFICRLLFSKSLFLPTRIL